MTLIKTSILTAISTIIKVISSFIINKIISLYIGPSGLALIGNLQNLISSLLVLLKCQHFMRPRLSFI